MASFVTTQQLRESPSGRDCIFIKIGDAGMKIYRDEYERNEQYDWQNRLCREGIAPKCWFKFDFEGPKGEKLFAYYSELAEVRDTLGWDTCTEISLQLYRTLRDKLGIDWGDCHTGNVGRLNGKDVIIDFGYLKIN